MLDFPAAPYNGQTYAGSNGITYQWQATPALWIAMGATGTVLSPVIKTLRSFGAMGDGTTDDKAAIDRAFAAQAASSGMILDGENLLYASMGKHLLHHSGVHLQNARFKNLDQGPATGHYFLIANTLAFTRIIGNIVPGPDPTVPGTKRTGILTITSYLIGGPATAPPAYNLGIQVGMRITKQTGGEVISCYVLSGSGMSWVVDVSQTTYSRVNVGNWANSTVYAADERADDGLEPREWKVLVPHTSAASGTFAQDRAAHPTYWGPVPDMQMNGHMLLDSCTLKNVKVDRNNMLQQTPSSNGMTVYIVGYKNVLIEDYECWGDGVGRGLQVECSADIKIIRPYIHDMAWRLPTNAGVGGEMVMGIFVPMCDTVLIDGHVIKHLEGYADGVPQKGSAYVPVFKDGAWVITQTYQNTDGVGIAGCQNVTVCNGETWDVGEGIDVSGTRSHNVRLLNNSYYDCNGYAEKTSSEQWYITSIGARSYRAGYYAFVTSGSSVGGVPNHVTWIDAHAYDTGFYGAWYDVAPGTPNPPLTGANWQIAGFGTGATHNLRLIGCKSHSPYQKYAVDIGGVAAGDYEISDLQSSGYTIAEFADVTAAVGVTKFMPNGGYKVLGTFDVTGAATLENDTTVGTNPTRNARFATSSGDFVTLTLRYDDVNIFNPLNIANHGITGVGDGVQQRANLARGNATTALFASMIETLATEDWGTIPAEQSAEVNIKVATNGNVVEAATFDGVNGLWVKPATAVTAASNSQAFIKASNATNGLGIYFGAGAPTGMSAAKGSLYTNTTATTTTTRLYVNTDGAAAWATLTTSS